MNYTPAARDLVLVGGGHSHAIVLKMLGMARIPGLRISLLSDVTHAPYSGMLPGLVAGLYSYDEAHIDLNKLCNFAGARFIRARVIGLDVSAKRVICDDRPPLGYDVLSINTGITPEIEAVPGALENAIPVKPVPLFLEVWDEILGEAEESPESVRRLAVVGGGAGGVELALAVDARLKKLYSKLGAPSPEVQLIHKQHSILDTHSQGARSRIENILKRRGISTITGDPVVCIDGASIHCSSGKTLNADKIFWVTSAEAASWPKASGLEVDDQGFIKVDQYLRSASNPDVFAAGDIASMSHAPRPKSGVFAVRQGRPLFLNIKATVLGDELRAYQPQEKFLSLIGTGKKTAVASRGNFAQHGRLMWFWKDRIDRRFMRRFSELPSMDSADASMHVPGGDLAEDVAILNRQARMRCAGCGSKVGATILYRTIERIRSERQYVRAEQEILAEEKAEHEPHCEIVVGLDEPDDSAAFNVPPGHTLVQSIDYFPALLSDPFLFGRITVNHCFSDIFAMGASPSSSLALVVAPFEAAKKMEETLFQLLSGVMLELDRIGAVLLGGHTSEGDRLGLGLMCNGIGEAESLMRKGGLREGDVLILTKPLGTGTLFAADMRLKAKGRWIDSAVDWMLMSNKAAADCFLRYGASACTDVTGFGLAGHAIEVAEASLMKLCFNLSDIPTMSGACEMISEGVLSSLHVQNAEIIAHLECDPMLAHEPKFKILFDPQTSGGLFAGVPSDRADTCLAELRRIGYGSAAKIGVVQTQVEEGDEAFLRINT